MVQETTTSDENKESTTTVYDDTSLIKTIISGIFASESIYTISSYWSTPLNTISDFTKTNKNMFNTILLPQLTSLYETMINNPITTGIVTTGVGVGLYLTNKLRDINFGDVVKTDLTYGENLIETISTNLKKIINPTLWISGFYSIISGTHNSWSLFNSNILKNTSQILGNYSALFTTIGIGVALYSTSTLTKNVTNLTRGIYEKGIMVKDITKYLFKGTFKKDLSLNSDGIVIKTESVNSVQTTQNTNIKSEQVKFFERLNRVGKNIKKNKPITIKN